MHCLQCQHQNSDTAKFCEECGARLITACPQCGHQASPTAKFCAECGTVLTLGEKGKRGKGEGEVTSSQSSVASSQPPAPNSQFPPGERRQLTVMFIDLVGSTTLSQQLDPEDYHARVRAYQTACGQIITRYDGHIAQYLGDGMLVYFGYPAAHEDDAGRAVRSGLEIVAAVGQLHFTPPLQIRIGIHTGPVVVAEIGTGAHTEQLALGETPNLAARIQGIAKPDEVVISAATYHLVEGLFEYEDRGQPELKGVSTSLTVYHVVKEGEAQSRFQVVARKGLTPLVGREHEYGLLRERWDRAKRADGQVVMLSGEPGIGKSRLVEMLKEYVGQEGATRIEFRCSPYYQNSALYPVIDHLQRVLQFERDDAPVVKLAKLQRTLSRYRFPQRNTFPLLATLLSLPHPAGVPPLQMSPQKQKEQTLETLVKWLGEEADKQPVYCAWEDLHWADPSSLDVLSLLLDQVPTARMLVVLTFRPEFTSPWGTRSHLNHLTLTRLTPEQAAEMVHRVAGGQTLSSELVRHVIAKTDGVPLFLEELTKAVVESGVTMDQAPLHTIPVTLLDSLMARLDRLGPAKEILQWGATLGREFSYEVLQVVSGLDEVRLQHGLKHVVAAELVYQSGLPPQAHYLFKHALVQDAAYQSLLKSTRQQYHRQIAHMLEAQFPEVTETQPELLAHHYTEAGLIEQAIPYWQRAGQRAGERSANVEAISHLTKALELLKSLPDTPERIQQELDLQTTLGPVLMAAKGYAAPEVGQVYARARELCQQIGNTPQLGPVLHGLWGFYVVRTEHRAAYELGEQLLSLAESQQDTTCLIEAHWAMGATLFLFGELTAARAHVEQSLALYNLREHRSLAFVYGHDPGMSSLCFAALALWHLGYPDQALKSSQAAVSLAREVAHPFSLVYALNFTAWCHQFRREGQRAKEQAEAGIALSTEHGVPLFLAQSSIFHGRALAEQEQGEEGVAQICQGLATYRASGGECFRPYFLALLAEAYGRAGQVEEGLAVLAEALDIVNKTGERVGEAELYRLAGELTLRMGERETGRTGEEEKIAHSPIHPFAHSSPEACFFKAIEIAQKQQAKSLELRAVMSLARLRQQQATQSVSRITQHEARAILDEAHTMLSEVYHWFTEGFDTKDLQEAKALLQELA